MKKITLIMALLSAISLFGQKRVAQHVQQLADSKTVFKPVAPLLLSETRNPKADAVVNNATYAVLNTEANNAIAANRYETIELSIPYNNGLITMQLYRSEVTAEGFHADTNKQQGIAYTAGAHYRGIVKGDSNSIASFSFFNGEMSGIVSAKGINNVVVGKLKTAGNTGNYIIYSDSQINAANNFHCATEDNDILPGNKSVKRTTQEIITERCVTVYFEVSYNIYLACSSDTTLTLNWLTAMFNNVQTLYDNDGINTALKSSYIWTEPEPYFGETSSDYLVQFYATRPVFDGDVGQLLTMDAGGLGGVAISIGGFCTDYRLSFSDLDVWFEEVPVFSWTVQVVTHELGHLFGSPHTHGCYWNGNGTAIDGCGTTAGYVEGECNMGPIPYDTEGTIMSYCHLVEGVGINFANGFGPQPAQLIINTVDASSCLSTDCINTCFNNVISFDLLDSDRNSATVRINYAEGTEASWQVGYAPYGFETTNWQYTDSAEVTLTGLQENTYYDFYVRTLCGENQYAQAEVFQFMTGADWCQGVEWTDTGGIQLPYDNSQHVVRIVKPNPGTAVSVTFTSFITEQDFDFMYVYDGIGNTAPLIGAYSGYDNIGPFTASESNESGALTFEFISDENTYLSGWRANITCTPLNTKTNTFSNLSYYPNPVNGNLTITATEGLTNIAIYNIAGQLLAQKEVSGTTDVTDMSAYAAGVYLIKVGNGHKTANLKVIKQ